jgi:UDP-N-acetylmuramate--alanine ligase
VAVAGSHGKTTTTSMVAMVLDHGGLDPTVVVGGRLGVLGSGAKLGRGDYMVVEADESDRSFLRLSPTVAVVTNIDREHLDTYRDMADLQEAFLGFVNKVPFYGSAVLCLDDGPLQDILSRVQRRVITYGVSPNAHVGAREVTLGPGGASYTAVRGGDVLGRVELRVPGAHNVLNSLAAVAVGLDLEVAFEQVQAGLHAFTGVDRRFQQRGEKGGVLVIDDYGHHPTEIRATLEALRTVAGARRCVVLFQPHRYSRTQHLWDEFCRCFLQADVLLLSDVYAAGEEPIEKVSALALAEAIEARGHQHVRYAGDLKSAIDAVAAEVREGDVVLTLGAGNVWTAGEELLRRMAR